MVTITAARPGAAAVPHTTAVSAIAVLRGEGADAMFPIKVVVPWEHLKGVVSVGLTLRAPAGFQAELVITEPAGALCERMVVIDGALDAQAEPLAAGFEVVVRAGGEAFPCGVKFTNRAGAAGAVVGEADEVLTFQAFSRLYRR